MKKFSRTWESVPTIGDPKEEEAIKLRRRHEEFEKALTAAGIPSKSRFRTASLDNYDTPTREHEEALVGCRDAVDCFQSGGGVLLIGEPGGGKTHLVIGMLREAMIRGMTGKYLTLTDFFALMRGCISADKADLDCIEELAKYQVLALDDMYSIASAKSSTEQSYQYEKLWHLLDKRYFYGTATIASTNKDIDAFREMLDERTTRRLDAIQILVPRRK